MAGRNVTLEDEEKHASLKYQIWRFATNASLLTQARSKTFLAMEALGTDTCIEALCICRAPAEHTGAISW